MIKKPPAIDLDAFDLLVSSIYDAAMDSALWPVFVERLTQALNAKAGLLRFQDLQSKEVGLYITHNVNTEAQQLYREHYVHQDPLMAMLNELAPATVIQTVTKMPESYKKSEFFNDYIAPQEVDNIAGCFVVKNNSQVATLGVHRSAHAGWYEKHELALLDRLNPHLQRAFQINAHLLQLADKVDISSDIMHRMCVGIILLDASGRPVFLNKQAETIVADGRGLTIARSGLQGPALADTKALRKLIHEATQSLHKKGGTLSISSTSLLQPLSVLVIPVGNREKRFDLFGIDASQATAALFISTSENQQHFSLEVLSQLYGLSKAEARLAGALTNGLSLDEISEQFKVSKNTVRSQLKACFQKMGVNRQTELVKLILCGPAALVGDDDPQMSG